MNKPTHSKTKFDTVNSISMQLSYLTFILKFKKTKFMLDENGHSFIITGLKQQNNIPKVLIDFCEKAVQNKDQMKELEVTIKVKLGGRDITEDDTVDAIISKYTKKIKEEVHKANDGLGLEE